MEDGLETFLQATGLKILLPPLSHVPQIENVAARLWQNKACCVTMHAATEDHALFSRIYVSLMIDLSHTLYFKIYSKTYSLLLLSTIPCSTVRGTKVGTYVQGTWLQCRSKY